MGVDQYLHNTYKSSSKTNMEAYLDVMGVEEPIKSNIINAELSLTLTKSGKAYTVKTSSVLRDHDITFVPGEEYEDIGMCGRTYHCVSNIEGNKILTTITSDPPATIVSEFGPDQVVCNMSAAGVQAQTVYDKV